MNADEQSVLIHIVLIQLRDRPKAVRADISISRNSGTLSRPGSSPCVKPMPPAPMNATLNDMESILLILAMGENSLYQTGCGR